VKFTPEEMAYEPPADVSDPKRFPTVARGRKEWQQFLSAKRGYVRLDPDVRACFPDDKVVNELLREVMQLAKRYSPAKRKKSA
jgi:hypothetical protein